LPYTTLSRSSGPGRHSMKRRLGLGAFAVALSLATPVAAFAAEEATTTTVEIEISATSIAPESESNEVPEETLPFTGSGEAGTALAAGLALTVGVGLVLLSRNAGGATEDGGLTEGVVE